jgi:hypothetical protein
MFTEAERKRILDEAKRNIADLHNGTTFSRPSDAPPASNSIHRQAAARDRLHPRHREQPHVHDDQPTEREATALGWVEWIDVRIAQHVEAQVEALRGNLLDVAKASADVLEKLAASDPIPPELRADLRAVRRELAEVRKMFVKDGDAPTLDLPNWRNVN